jgi:HEAT repeat protein/beta-lactamase regulating signal transducer with metallopeptidase domain
MLDWLLTYAVQSTLLLAAAWVLAGRARSHRVREALWKTALFGGFVTASVQSLAGFNPIFGTVVLRSAAIAPLPPAAKARFVAEPTAALEGQSPTDTPGESDSRQVAAGKRGIAPGPRLTKGDLVVVAWLALAGLLLASYLLRRALLARRIANRKPVMTHPLAEQLRQLANEAGIARPIRLTVSARLSSPVALGSCEIAVPEAALTELDPEQQRSMLAHELAHLERRDPAWLIAAALAERIGFFQPLNRQARRRIQESAEYLCDEWAVRQTGSGVFLAKCLAKVAEWIDAAPTAIPVAGMAEERSHLMARVQRLLDSAPFPLGPGRGTVVLLASLGVLGFTLAVPGVSLAGPRDPGARDAAPAGDERNETERQAGADTSRAVLRALMEASRDPDVEVRKAALHSLSRYEDPQTVGVFREALKDGDPEIRRIGVRALAELKDRSSVSAIAALLKDENTELRRTAADALAELPAGAARAELVAALKDSDAEVRANVIRALAELKDPSMAEALVGALKDPKAEVRARAIEALQELELADPPAAILDALRDPSAEVRHQAANAVGHFQDARAIPQLRALIGDPDREVREAAVEALAEIRTEAAIEALVSALKSKDPKVRRAAADALGRK